MSENENIPIVPPTTSSNGNIIRPEVTPSSETSNPSNRNRRRFPRRSDNQIMSESRSFVGETPELGAVVGLLSERLDKGVTMEQFQEKLKLYVLKNYKKGEDVVTLVEDLVDPRIDFETKHAPADLTPEEEIRTSLMNKWEIKFKK